MEQTDEMVLVSAARLRELEETVTQLKEKLNKRNHNNTERLKEYRRTHPEVNAEGVKRWKEKNREAYNARRRELYRQKKEAAAAGTPGEG